MESASKGTGKIKTAVISGHHEYDVVALQTLCRGIPEIDPYPQNMEDFVTDTRNSLEQYEVLVFYNYHLPTPGSSGDELGERMKMSLDSLGETRQGILVLHHAIVAFPGWQKWSDICGIQERADVEGAGDQRVRIQVADPEHPITKGLTSWEMTDETYIMADADVGVGSEVLLTTDHPRSMKTIAWTRQYRNARVFCYQSGHDNAAYSDPSFRTVIARGIQWLAGRI